MNKGGWTRLVNKIGNTNIFDRPYKDYVYGFGEPSDNHWIGLRNMRNLVINEEMQIRLQFIVNWFKDSWLKVNESQTEMCLFHHSYLRIIHLTINNINITSTPQINVLGVIFNYKLQWTEIVSKTVKKADKAHENIKFIKNINLVQKLQ